MTSFPKDTFSAIRGRQISEAIIKRRLKPTEAGAKIALNIQRDFKFPGDDEQKPDKDSK